MKKKRIILELLCTAIAVFSSGCGMGGAQPGEGANEGTSSIFEDTGVSQNAEKADESTEETGNNENAGETGSPSEENVQLQYESTLYITDDKGNLINEYDLEKISEQFAQQGIKLDPRNYNLYSAGVLYYSCDVYDGEQSNYSVIYAVDPKEDKAEVVYQTQKGTMAYYLDEYKDKLYFETYGQGEDNFTGHCFEINDGLSFKESDFEYDSFLDNDNGYIIKQELNKSYTSVSVPKILGEVGFVVAEKDNDLYRMEEGKEPELIYDTEDGYSPYVYFYDKNKVIFSLTDENYNDSQKYALDIASGKADLIIDDKKAVATDFNDGIFYYYISLKLPTCKSGLAP